MINLTEITKAQIQEITEDTQINWRVVSSSFVAQVAWVHTGNRHGIVLVAIQNAAGGGLYAYHNVPSWVYAAWFMPGTSVGSFFNQVFKGRFGGQALARWVLAAPVAQVAPKRRQRFTTRQRRVLEAGRKFGLNNRQVAA